MNMREVLIGSMTEPRRRPTLRPFTKGMIFTFCVLSLVQDYIGQEAYIQLARDHWVAWYYSVPIALSMIAFVYWADDETS